MSDIKKLQRKIRQVVLKASEDLASDEAPVTGDALNGLARLVNSLRKLEETGKPQTKKKKFTVPSRPCREDFASEEEWTAYCYEYGRPGAYEELLG